MKNTKLRRRKITPSSDEQTQSSDSPSKESSLTVDQLSNSSNNRPAGSDEAQNSPGRFNEHFVSFSHYPIQNELNKNKKSHVSTTKKKYTTTKLRRTDPKRIRAPFNLQLVDQNLNLFLPIPPPLPHTPIHNCPFGRKEFQILWGKKPQKKNIYIEYPIRKALL